MNPSALAYLSSLPQDAFVHALDGIFEHSPWIPARVWAQRPFASVGTLHRALMDVVRRASPAEQQTLVAAYPELAGHEAAAGTLTAASTSEQRGAGLDQCSAVELARLRALNAAYRARFGFPCVIAVKGRNRYQIMQAIADRLHHDGETELAIALDQIGQIARFRLAARLAARDALLPAGPGEAAPLLVEPLTRAAFKPFGDVIEADDSVPHFAINDGNTERYHDLARIVPGADGHAIVSIFRGQPRTLPFSVTLMERHPRASQAFVPLSGRPYLVVVAEPAAAPTRADLRTFLCTGRQGVNYAPGVWHHPLLALDAVSDFLVIDRAGPGENCDVVRLAAPAVISCATPNADSAQ